jgi:hypothetical protein
MATADDIAAEVLRWIRWPESETHAEDGIYCAAEALAAGRFLIRNKSRQVVLHIAARIVLQLSIEPVLWREAYSLGTMTCVGSRSEPPSIRSVLSRRRKQWRKEERAKTKDQGPA